MKNTNDETFLFKYFLHIGQTKRDTYLFFSPEIQFAPIWFLPSWNYNANYIYVRIIDPRFIPFDFNAILTQYFFTSLKRMSPS